MQLRQDDPATAAMQLPAIDAAFEPVPGEVTGDPDFNPGAERLAALRLRLQAQTAIGVAQPRLLQHAEAGRMADRLTTMADGRVAAFQDLKQTYGDLYPALLTELGDRNFGGLPPKLRVLGSVTGSDAPSVLARELDRALAMVRGGSDETPADDVPAGIAATVRSRLGPMLPDDTDPDTNRDNQALADAAIALARHRIANGDDPTTAVQFAVEDLTGIKAVRDDFSLLPDPAEEDGDDFPFGAGNRTDVRPTAPTMAELLAQAAQDDGLGTDFFGPVGSQLEEVEVAMAGGGRGLLTRGGTFERERLDRFDEFTRRLALGERSRNLTSGLIRDAADKNASTQQALREAASEEELALGKLLLSLIPGLGTVMNGTEAIEAFREALELERAGKLDQAMEKRREAALDAAAALGPLALIAKSDKIAKAFRFLVGRAKRNRDAARRAEGDNGQAIAKAATAAAQGQRLLGKDRDTITPESEKPTKPLTKLPKFLRAEPDGFIEGDDVRKLPSEGFIDPWSVRTSQDSGGRDFTEDESGKSKSIFETTNQLIAETGTKVRDKIPCIELVVHEGQLWTMDNRRVIAARLAGKPIRYKILLPTKKVIKRLLLRMSTRDKGITIRIRSE